MGLFGIKKEDSKEDFNNNVFFNTPQDEVKAFAPGSNASFNSGNETVLAPQPVVNSNPEVLESNIQNQNTTYNASSVAPLGVSAPTIKPTANVETLTETPKEVSIPSVSTPTNTTVQTQPQVQQPQVQAAAPIQTTQEVEAQKQQMDALNNANNPVPVNPVAPKEEIVDYANVEVKYKDIIGLCINSLIKPGTTMEVEGNKYRDSIFHKFVGTSYQM